MTHQNADDGPDSGSLSSDEALGILADGMRRSLLLELLERPPDDAVGLTSTESVEAVFGDASTGAEADTAGGGKAARDPREIELRHHHLPRLAEADLIRWDTTGPAVSRGPTFDEIEPFLCGLDEHSGKLPADWDGRRKSP